MRYKQRFRRPARSPAAFMVRHHRQHRERMVHVATRRLQQNPFRWYRIELRKARFQAWLWRLEQEDDAAHEERTED